MGLPPSPRQLSFFAPTVLLLGLGFEPLDTLTEEEVAL